MSQPESFPKGFATGPKVGGASLLALGVNGVVGVGIFFTPNLLAQQVPGNSGALVFLATAALLLPIAVAVATLGYCLPIDGGPSIWARAAFGEAAGYVVGFIAAISAVVSMAAVLAGVGEQIAGLLSLASPGISSFLACFTVVLLGSISACGLRPSAWTWSLLTVLKLVPLGLLVGLFAWTVLEAPGSAAHSRENDFSSNFGRAVLISLFPLQGFEAVPVLAGSVQRRRATLPVATAGSLLIAAVLYAAVQLACVAALPDLPREKTPLVSAATVFGGTLTGHLVQIGTQISALGVAFAMVVLTPRYLSVLGTPEGFGSWLGKIDSRGVPRPAFLLTIGCVVVLLSSMRTVEALLVLSSASVLVVYVTALAALLRLAIAKRHGLSWVAAIPALLGVGAVTLLAGSLTLRELLVLGLAFGVGFLLWAFRRVLLT